MCQGWRTADTVPELRGRSRHRCAAASEHSHAFPPGGPCTGWCGNPLEDQSDTPLASRALAFEGGAPPHPRAQVPRGSLALVLPLCRQPPPGPLHWLTAPPAEPREPPPATHLLGGCPPSPGPCAGCWHDHSQQNSPCSHGLWSLMRGRDVANQHIINVKEPPP